MEDKKEDEKEEEKEEDFVSEKLSTSNEHEEEIIQSKRSSFQKMPSLLLHKDTHLKRETLKQSQSMRMTSKVMKLPPHVILNPNIQKFRN